jgi:hypothetical protein
MTVSDETSLTTMPLGSESILASVYVVNRFPNVEYLRKLSEYTGWNTSMLNDWFVEKRRRDMDKSIRTVLGMVAVDKSNDARDQNMNQMTEEEASKISPVSEKKEEIKSKSISTLECPVLDISKKVRGVFL